MNEAIQVLTDRRMESLASAMENILCKNQSPSAETSPTLDYSVRHSFS